MENENIENNYKKNKNIKRTPGEKNYRFIIFVLLMVILVCVLFSGFQSVYIFRLNNGLEGILSYAKSAKRNDTAETSVAKTETGHINYSELPEPWFSLEDATAQPSSDKTRMSVVDIVKEVSPATVSLSLVGADNGMETKIGSGTGFIITDDGYIVTNRHVVVMSNMKEDAYYVTVILPDEKTPVRAEVIGSDAQTDIAVLKVKTERKLPCVTLGDSDTLQAGELAVAIGNAMGTLDDTVTVGVISARSRETVRNGYHLDIIQTDAAINPGNSGGPLINSFGEVIGITNSKIITSTSENLGFAIPVNSVKKVIESIINYGMVVDRPYLGVTVQYITEGSYYGAPGGVFVAETVKDGPAWNAGLMSGDKIISLDGVEIKETGDIIRVRDSHVVGDTIDAVVERDGEELTLPLQIGNSADFPE